MRVFLQKVLALLSQIKPFLRSSCLRIFVALQANQRKIRKRRIFYGGFIMEKEQCKSFIKRITLDEFNNLIKNINMSALLTWLSFQTEDTQKLVFSIQFYVNKLIDKYGERAGLDTRNNRSFLAFGMSVKILKQISAQRAVDNIDKKVPYKEGIIKNNVDIIERIIFELVSNGNKKWQWEEVFKEFFKRIDKRFLRGNDKLKRDCSKIMTLSYFKMMAKKHIFEKSRQFEENIRKADIDKLIEDSIKSSNARAKETEFMIKADEFNSYNK